MSLDGARAGWSCNAQTLAMEVCRPPGALIPSCRHHVIADVNVGCCGSEVGTSLLSSRPLPVGLRWAAWLRPPFTSPCLKHVTLSYMLSKACGWGPADGSADLDTVICIMKCIRPRFCFRTLPGYSFKYTALSVIIELVALWCLGCSLRAHGKACRTR